MITNKVVETAIAPRKLPEDVGRMIEAATAILGQELARYLGVPAETKEVHHGGRPFILLYDDPIEGEDLSVEVRSGPTQPWELVDPTEYALEGRKVLHAHCWPRGISAIRVTYTRGYELDEGPPQLRDLVLEIVKAKILDRGKEGMTSETIGDYSYTKSDLTRADSWPMVASRWRRNRP